MSSNRIEKIECRHCHKEGEMCIWHSVNVDLNPELREKIFSEELFTYHCPHCGKEMGIPVGTVYHDMKHKFMLFFEFFKPDDFNYFPLELPQNIIKNSADYTFRLVFGLMRFKEKIILLEQGLDDVAIERQKYMFKHIIQPDIAQKGYDIYFNQIEEPDKDYPYGKISFYYYDDEKGGMGVQTAMDSYFESRLACSLDPRMVVNGCHCVDEGWIKNQMRGE